MCSWKHLKIISVFLKTSKDYFCFLGHPNIMLVQVPSLGEEKDRLKLEVTLAGADGRQ